MYATEGTTLSSYIPLKLWTLIPSAIEEVKLAVYADRYIIEKNPQTVWVHLPAQLVGGFVGIVFPETERVLC